VAERSESVVDDDHRPVPDRGDRGMVTAELAMGSLFVAAFVGMVAWVITLLMAWTLCQNTAAEVARQEARGDVQASEAAQQGKPAGATVSVSRRGDAVRVEVNLRAQPWASWLPAVPLSASAEVLAEKG